MCVCAPCEKPRFLFMVASNLIWADLIPDHPTSCQTGAKFASAPQTLWPFTMAVKVAWEVKLGFAFLHKGRKAWSAVTVISIPTYAASRCEPLKIYDLYCGILAEPERFYAVVTYFMPSSIEMYTRALGPQVSHNMSWCRDWFLNCTVSELKY